MHKIEHSIASSEVIIEALGKRLENIRLSRNISQFDLARKAGVSRNTITRLSSGRPISLDSFVRIMQALNLTDHLISLLPDPKVRPVDHVRLGGTERQRARKKRVELSEWTWGDGREK